MGLKGEDEHPKLPAGVSDARNLVRPRVLISYSHESEGHKRACLELADTLRREGVDAWIDQYEPAPPEGFPRWIRAQLEQAAYTLVICTPTYRERFEGRSAAGRGQGVNWEGFLSEQKLYEDDARNRRFIPILFAGEVDESVPAVLRASARYRLPAEYEQLYRRLTNQPAVVPQPLGELRQLGPRSPAQDEELQGLIEEQRALRMAGRDSKPVDDRILVRKRQLRDRVPVGCGTRLCASRFELVEQIGQGSYGTVWKAYDTLKAQPVAVKVLHPNRAQDESHRHRFFRGASRMAQLGHPGIVKVVLEHGEEYSSGEDSELLRFYAMELVGGGDLGARVRSGHWNRDETVSVLRKVGEALAHAHERGLIHRDVRPENIVLTADGQPKLTDFDLVRAQDTLASTGGKGAYFYMPPEAFRKDVEVDERTDVYALSMVGVFMLCGGELTEDVKRDEEKFIAQLVCGSALKRVLAKGCAWRADERYPTVAAFLQALQEGVQEPPPGPTQQIAQRAASAHPPKPVSPPDSWLRAGESWALRFIAGKYQGTEFPLPMDSEVVIGRSSDLDMVIVEDMVSRRHAKLVAHGNGVTVIDLGSSNGIFLNGERVSRQAEMKEGGRLLIGTSMLTLGRVTGAPVVPRHSLEAPSVRRADNPRFSGLIEDVPLTDVLQLSGVGTMSGTLVAESGSWTGRIHVERGSVIAADLRGATTLGAAKALYRILSWSHGIFRFLPLQEDRTGSIETTIPAALNQSIQLRQILAASGLPPMTATIRVPKPLPLDAPLRKLTAEQLDVFHCALSCARIEDVFNGCPMDDADIAQQLPALIAQGYIELADGA